MFFYQKKVSTKSYQFPAQTNMLTGRLRIGMSFNV